MPHLNLHDVDLTEVKPEDFTIERLRRKNDVGVTALMIAARLGHIQCVPPQLLTAELIHEQHQIPEGYEDFGQFLRHERKEIKHESVAEYLLRTERLHTLPQELLTEEACLAAPRNIVLFAINRRRLNHLPDHLFTEKLLMQPTEEGTPLLRAVSRQQLDARIPKHLLRSLTPQDLKDCIGNPEHVKIIAEANFPESFYTAPIQDYNSPTTFLHYCARNNSLRALPREIVVANLTTALPDGTTLLHQGIAQIIEGFLRNLEPRHLLVQNRKGETPLTELRGSERARSNIQRLYEKGLLTNDVLVSKGKDGKTQLENHEALIARIIPTPTHLNNVVNRLDANLDTITRSIFKEVGQKLLSNEERIQLFEWNLLWRNRDIIPDSIESSPYFLELRTLQEAVEKLSAETLKKQQDLDHEDDEDTPF